MRKVLLFLLLLNISLSTWAQVVTVSPNFPQVTDAITLTFDVTQAADSRAAGLLGLTDDVFLWSGAGDEPNGNRGFIYGPTGQTDFGAAFEPGRMMSLGDDRWSITLTPDQYYNIPSDGVVRYLGVLLKNEDGSAQTEDLFVEIFDSGFNISLNSPMSSQIIVDEGEMINIDVSLSEAADVEVFVDNVSEATFTGVTNIAYDLTATGSNEVREVRVVADNGSETREVGFNFAVIGEPNVAPLPDGIVDGINYDPNDDTKVTLVLTAPNKEFSYVVGDFTDWELQGDFFMNRTPDGNTYWIEVDGLTAGQDYVFQYWVNGVIQIGDPYADQVADPWNDSFIPTEVYPNLPDFDRTDLAIATVLRTGQQAFPWAASEDTWVRPAKEDLVIYELLVRDFIGSHYYQDLIDSLSYLKGLGINAIELMPITEFEGNESWGYNPMYMFAPDKYYGTKNDLKEFIQAAHQEGIAVILDMVLNHQFGLSPLVRLDFNFTTNRLNAESPWFNVDATHPFNVGFDMNHESTFTQDFVDSVNTYWLTEYHFDGYRYDLSKGFTQNVGRNPNDVGAWSQFDQSRIDILTRMNNRVKQVDPTAYVILEHFADQSEENVLEAEGMISWRNVGFDYRSALSGTSTSRTFNSANTTGRVSYIESHDEQRVLREVRESGRSEGDYDIEELETALDRIKLGLPFFYTLPGPKLMWQFQEVGYDLDINTCRDGTTITEGCRVDNKPLPWGEGNLGYFENEERQKLLEVHRAVMNFVKENRTLMSTGQLSTTLGSDIKRIAYENDNGDIVIVGNFDLARQQVRPEFTQTGTWFDFFSGKELTVTSVNEQLLYEPGEFHIYTTTPASFTPPEDILPFEQEDEMPEPPVTSLEEELFNQGFRLFPNPASSLVNIVSPEIIQEYAIIDSKGLRLSSEKVSLSEFSFGTDQLTSGLYIIQLKTSEKNYNLRLIIE